MIFRNFYIFKFACHTIVTNDIIHIDFNVKRYLLESRMLLKSTYGCPSDTYGCTGETCHNTITCFCGQHCSWAECRLQEPPDDCLIKVNGKWEWDMGKMSWVAQMAGIRLHFTRMKYASSNTKSKN